MLLTMFDQIAKPICKYVVFKKKILFKSCFAPRALLYNYHFNYAKYQHAVSLKHISISHEIPYIDQGQKCVLLVLKM